MLSDHSLSKCLWCWCIVAKRLDWSRWILSCSRPQPWPRCVRWGPSSPKPKEAQRPQFLSHIYCIQMAGSIKMPLGREVGLSPSDIVLDGDPAPPSQKGAESPNFRPISVVAWIKMPLGREVGLIQRDIVLGYCVKLSGEDLSSYRNKSESSQV